MIIFLLTVKIGKKSLYIFAVQIQFGTLHKLFMIISSSSADLTKFLQLSHFVASVKYLIVSLWVAFENKGVSFNVLPSLTKKLLTADEN